MPKLILEIPIINGCGTLSYLDTFDRLEKMGACFGAWVPKSIGPYSRDPGLREKYGWGIEKPGNPNPVVVHTGHIQLNSMGLPTHPVESWIEEFESTPLRKPIIGSVYGNKPEDYARLIGMFDKYVIAWQANISCPNKEKGEKSIREIMTSKSELIFAPLRDVTKKPVFAKLSPAEDYVGLAEILKEHVDGFVCGNTEPGLVIDIYSRRPILAGIYGGMSGPATKPKKIKMVNDVYDVIKGSNLQIIASGGIESYEDVIEYAIAGASIFELGTCFAKTLHDGRVIGRTNQEIVNLTKRIWEGIQNFLIEQDITLDKLVGSLVK